MKVLTRIFGWLCVLAGLGLGISIPSFWIFFYQPTNDTDIISFERIGYLRSAVGVLVSITLIVLGKEMISGSAKRD